MVLPLLGMAGIATAKAVKPAKGSTTWCATHKKNALCKNTSTGSGSGGATGGAPAAITVVASPNPLVETGQSEIDAVIQVSTSPAYAGDQVLIDSSQLDGSCSGPVTGPHTVNTGSLTGITFFSISDPGGSPDQPEGFAHSILAVLDDDGNATVTVSATDCAPGSDVIAADLEVSPYVTALTTLIVNPPVVTTAGLTGYPTSPPGEVETGDTQASGESDIYTVFYVESSPVYAEQPVTINSAQLQSRCGDGWYWSPGNAALSVAAGDYATSSMTDPTTPETTLDDDGNAVFVFYGASCAAGDSSVIAEVDAGTHPTYVTTFTVNPPTPPASGPPVP
jgi:hypothetical protein